ncbi:MAG TPA: hypothetical protein P5532_05655 [Planctomycetota bacterium]|nr:hypothetical protein [Planctomycetota bacterium]HRT93887.1 hypothetical protein [Planctomycetota bacterium]
MPVSRCVAVALSGVLALVGCSSGTQERAEGAWGAVADGFRASLRSPRAVVALGEPIELRVRVRNAVGEIRDFASAHDVALRVSRGDASVGDDLDYVTLAPEAMKLPPGEEREFPLRKYPTSGDAAKLCGARGLYRFQGTLGKMELPPIEIRVE